MTVPGKLYGIGIGPGDPELITVKALRLLRAVAVVAYPAPDTGESLARRIVAGYLDQGQEELVIRVPMLVDRHPAEAVYDRAAETIGRHLGEGRDVVVLCEGDPFFYGSFMYLYARLAARHQVEVVPGVSSLTAAAASLGTALTARDDVLSVVPASLPAEAMAARLRQCDAAAIIKLGRHFARVREVLTGLGLASRARYIEHATMASQRILPLGEVDPAAVPYFSMILLHRRGEAWA